MSTLTRAAIRHLELCRLDRDPFQDILYVRLAFTYGLEVDAIAEASGLSIERVRTILGGAE